MSLNETNETETKSEKNHNTKKNTVARYLQFNFIGSHRHYNQETNPIQISITFHIFHLFGILVVVVVAVIIKFEWLPFYNCLLVHPNDI